MGCTLTLYFGGFTTADDGTICAAAADGSPSDSNSVAARFNLGMDIAAEQDEGTGKESGRLHSD